MKLIKRCPIVTAILITTIFICFQGCKSTGTESISDLKKWTDRVIPLPKEVTVDKGIKVKAGEIYLSPCSVKGLQIPTAEKILQVIARASTDLKSQIIISMALTNDKSVKIPEQIVQRLKNLPNSGQAYAISSEHKNNSLNIRLFANTPTGLLYAAQTLQLMIKPPQNVSVNTVLEIPVVNVIDWPDMEERGQWSGCAKWDYEWFRKWKLNFIEVYCRPGIDKKGNPITRFNKEQIKTAAKQGIKAIPFLPHIASLGGNANLRSALYRPELKHLLPVLGKPHDTDNGLSSSNPKTLDLITDWSMQLMEPVQGCHNDLEIWLTEGNRHCQEDRKKSNGKPKLIETEMILKAFERVKKKYPETRLRIWLSQGSYREKVHDDIIKMLPPDVGLTYYNGTRTYISDRNPMLPENLRKFSQNGGFMGIVPQVSHSWITVVPWTAPQFVHFRMKEFTDKKLNSISAYAVPGKDLHQFNLMAVAEWGWNAKGRTPEEFAVAYATVKGMKNPQLYAKWAMKVGAAGWELADSRFFATLNYDPALGFHGDRPFDHRFAYEDTYKSQMGQALADAEEALKIAKEYGDPDMMNESEFTLNGLKGLQLAQSISGKIKKANLSSNERKELTTEMDQLDECAQKVAVNVLAWGNRNAPKDRGYLIGMERMEFTVRSFMKCCEILRTMAASLGFMDARNELRPVELGEWKTNDFSKGKAEYKFNITDLLANNPERWNACAVETELLNGFKSSVTNAIFWDVDPKTGKKSKLYDLRGAGRKGSHWRDMEVFPVFKIRPGHKLFLEVKLGVICPKSGEFPADKKLHAKGTHGTISFRRIIKPEYLTKLARTSSAETAGKTGLCMFNRRAKGEKIEVGVFGGHGAEEIIKVLNQEKNINAFLLSKLNPKSLTKCHVIIVPQSSQTTQIIKYAKPLADWVRSGGGALFFHDAVGFRRQMPIFRTIGIGTDNPKLDKVKVVRKHAATKNISVGKVFSPGFKYDHVIIEKGPGGTVLIENEKNQPVVVVGNVGRGRIILNGMLTGFSSSKDNGAGCAKAPEEEELSLLINIVEYLSGKVNMLKDPGAEKPLKRDKCKQLVPAGWGFYKGSGHCQWGTTDKERKSGKNSMFLKFDKHQVIKKTGKKDFNAGIVIGAEDSYSGRKAIDVEPDTLYGFSFWLKGDTKVAIGIDTWNSKNPTVKDLVRFHRVKDPVNLHINGVLVGDPVMRRGVKVQLKPDKWQHYSGTFKTKAKTRKAAIRVGFADAEPNLNLKGGETIYIDDAEIFKKE